MKTRHRSVLIFLLAFALILLLQFAVHFKYADPDGYYHLKMASLISHGQIDKTFPWLEFTTWNKGYADQHFLFHLALTPFVRLNLAWLVVPFFSALMLTVFYWLLEKLGVRWKTFWLAVALFGSTDFLFRISIIKANTLSLVLLFIGFFLIYQKRYAWLLPLSAIFVWTYGGFVFLPVIVGLWCFIESLSERKVSWKPLTFSAVGIILGVVLHPQASHLTPYLRDQIFQAGLGAGNQVPVGVEWNRYDWSYFVKTNSIIIALWLASAVVFIKQFRSLNSERKPYTLLLFFVSLGFWVLSVVHRRFIEYSTPFSIIFTAYVFSPHLARVQWAEVKKLWKNHWQFGSSIMIVSALVIVILYFNTRQDLDYFTSSPNKNSYQNAATWLRTNSPEHSLVFNTQWDQFPQLFYWDDRNYYIVGMDPTFMYLSNEDLYWKWRQITDDSSSGWGSDEQIYSIIKSDFGASYVFIENKRNPNLLQNLAKNQEFNQVYSDSSIAIFAVR